MSERPGWTVGDWFENETVELVANNIDIQPFLKYNSNVIIFPIIMLTGTLVHLPSNPTAK